MPETPVSELLDHVWGRLYDRLDRPLGQLEAIISVLFDRKLAPIELTRSQQYCDLVARELSLLGFSESADLMRRAGAVLDRGELGLDDGLTIATLVDEARTAVVTTIAGLELVPRVGFELIVVGPLCETVDEIIWTASNRGLSVSHRHQVLFAGPTQAAAIVVVPEKHDVDRNQDLFRSIRNSHPSLPVIAVLQDMDPETRVIAAQAVTTILDSRTTTPVEILNEVQRGVLRHRAGRMVGVYGHGASWLAEQLQQRGLDCRVENDLADLFASIRSDDVRAVVLTPHADMSMASSADRHLILRLIRTDPTLRSVTVVIVDENADVARQHDALRKGADMYVGPEAELDDLTVQIKAKLERRGDSELIGNKTVGRRVESWESATVSIDRLLQQAARRRSTVGIVLVRLDQQDAKATSALDQAIVNQFRDDAVITRLDGRHLVIALDGIRRQTLVRRMSDIHRSLSLHELGAAIACVECPTEGRSLDAALERGEVLLRQIGRGEGPAVMGEEDQVDQNLTDVLILDPDPNVAKMLMSSLERRGMLVEYQSDGLDALDLLTGQTERPLPRVVLMDLDLRDIDGLAFLRLLAEAGTLDEVKVIVLSPRSNESELRVAFDLGIDDFVPKPLSIPLLHRRICRALER